MNTTKSQFSKASQNNPRQKTQQQQGRGKRGQNPQVLQEDRRLQEHEHPELRMTR
jgi:hypothetical protein